MTDNNTQKLQESLESYRDLEHDMRMILLAAQTAIQAEESSRNQQLRQTFLTKKRRRVEPRKSEESIASSTVLVLDGKKESVAERVQNHSKPYYLSDERTDDDDKKPSPAQMTDLQPPSDEQHFVGVNNNNNQERKGTSSDYPDRERIIDGASLLSPDNSPPNKDDKPHGYDTMASGQYAAMGQLNNTERLVDDRRLEASLEARQFQQRLLSQTGRTPQFSLEPPWLDAPSGDGNPVVSVGQDEAIRKLLKRRRPEEGPAHTGTAALTNEEKKSLRDAFPQAHETIEYILQKRPRR